MPDRLAWRSGEVEILTVLGGPGSGFHGHSGRPGQVGGSATEGFISGTPERRKELGLPPAWTNVRVNPDPDGELQATGEDAKGRTQYRYSAVHTQEAAAEKFERMKSFASALSRLQSSIEQDRDSENPVLRDTAEILATINETGFRIGSTQETKADVQAYGVTTLLGKHVKVRGDNVAFKFIGKKGVEVEKTVKSARMARAFLERKRGPNDPIFTANAGHVRKYMSEHAPGFTPKDFRTIQGTTKALEQIRKMPVPNTQKEFKAARKAVGEAVAKHLGNTGAVALKAYINPAVFAKWGAK